MITRTRRISMSLKLACCPRCGELSKRHCTSHRRLREVGISTPVTLDVTYSKHYCENCRKFFSLPMDHLAPKFGRFTHRVRRTAVMLVVKRAMTLDAAALRMRRKYFVNVPATTLHDWVAAEFAA